MSPFQFHRNYFYNRQEWGCQNVINFIFDEDFSLDNGKEEDSNAFVRDCIWEKTDNCSSQMRLECKTDYCKRFSIQFTIFPIQFISKDMDLFQKTWILRPLFNINLWPVEMNQTDTQLGTKVSSPVSWLNHIKTNNNMIQIS